MIANPPASSRTLTINGTAITFVASGATGYQCNVGASLNATALNLVAVINANSSTFGCTASAPTQYNTGVITNITLTATTAGTSGNSITVAWSDGQNYIWPYYPTFWGGLASGPLITTISGVNSANSINLATNASATVAIATNNYCHFGTDDYLAIVAAHSMAGLTGEYDTVVGTCVAGQAMGGVRKIRVTPPVFTNAGTAYLTSQPISIENGCEVVLERGSIVRAAPGFPSGRAVYETLVQTTPTANVAIMSPILSGPGSIEAIWADRGVWFRNVQYGTIKNKLNIIGAKWRGFELGDLGMGSGSFGSWSNNVGDLLIQSSGLPSNTGGINQPDSVGFYNSNGTDGVITGSLECVGYRYGFLSDASICVGPSHMWTSPGFGPMKACYVVRSKGVTLISPEGDTPCSLGDSNIGTCYMFWSTTDLDIIDASRCVVSSNGGLSNEIYYARFENYGTGRIVFYGAAYNSSGNSIALGRASSSPNTANEAAITFIGGLRTAGSIITNYGYASYELPNSSRKQWLDNSDFFIWRNVGPVQCFQANAQWAAERWYSQSDATTGSRTMSQVANAVSTAFKSEYALQIAQTSQATNGTFHTINQNLPIRSLLAIGNHVVTLLVRTTLVSGTFPNAIVANLILNFGTGGSTTVTIPIGNIFPGSQYTALQFTVSSFSGDTVTSNAFATLQLNIPLTNTANFVLNIVEPELVDGWWLTPDRTFQLPTDERVNEIKTYYESGSVYAPSVTAFWVPFKVSKFKTPTVTPSSGTATQISTEGFLLTPAASGTVTYNADASI